MRRLIIALAALSVCGEACAQVPISGLPGATTPLTGAEIVPLVQSSTTKQATVASVVSATTIAAGLGYTPLNKAGDTASGLITAPALSTIGASSAFTGSGQLVTTQTSGTTKTSIYNPQVPGGWFTYDGVSSAVLVGSATTATNTNGFGFYMRNQLASGGLGQNVVGLYGLATCETTGCATWGTNPALIDSSSPSVNPGSSARKLIGSEYDFTVEGSNTTVQGISLILQTNFSHTPTGNGFSCSNTPSGSAAKWTNCLTAADGTVSGAGIILGATATSAANLPSIPINLGVYDSGSTGHYVQLSGIPLGTNTGLSVLDNALANGVFMENSATGSGPTVGAQGSDTNINLNLAPKGTGSVRVQTGLTIIPLTTAGVLYNNSNGFVISAPYVRPATVVFSGLATADPTPGVGDQLVISDASTCTANSQVTAGGGSTHSCAVVYNGAGWIALVTH